MGMVHCYRCSLQVITLFLRNLYLLYLLTVTLIFYTSRELLFPLSSLTDSTILIPEWSGTMRLDKLLEELQFGSRKTVKRLIRGRSLWMAS